MRVALKAAIFASGNTQRQVAAAAGLPENKLSEIVRGWVDPTQAERAVLVRILGCSFDVFDLSTVEKRSLR
jgi:hypothetical protein